ncbi:MAG: hypothetical protein QM630_09715 [Microbacterium sp.]
MDAVEALIRRGGGARVDALRRDGVTVHALRRARESGAIVGVRRGWAAVRDADALLIAAARRGVILSCITLASRRGLWVRDSSQHHLAAPANAGHIAVARGVVHWNRPWFPRDPDSLEDSLENALIILSTC